MQLLMKMRRSFANHLLRGFDSRRGNEYWLPGVVWGTMYWRYWMLSGVIAI